MHRDSGACQRIVAGESRRSAGTMPGRYRGLRSGVLVLAGDTGAGDTPFA